MNRAETRAVFLRSIAIDPSEAVAMAGDASSRRYFRLPGSGQILMDAPPETGEDVRPFMAVTNWLRQEGFSAPRIDEADLDQGFLLLEDLGLDLYREVCSRNPETETTLYSAAIDFLAELGQLPAPKTLPLDGGEITLAPYDLAVLQREARLVAEWYVPGTSDGSQRQELAEELDDLLVKAMQPVAAACDVVVLRDFHAENLIWLPARAGNQRVGLLDYQDALAGHAAYDLVSLLEDARRDTSTELQDAMISRYLTRSGTDEQAFRQAYACLGAQRNLKIIGIFARLSLRDGKSQYPALIPRVWRHLQRDLTHPALSSLRHWVELNVPAPDAPVLAGLEAGRSDSVSAAR
ncbi:MAG: phosphotransferase [Pseudomonadota bacterium]